MELYRKVRLACRDGMSERAAARHFGVSRESVKKMLAFSVPPGYRRTAPVRRPKLDGFTGLIDEWLRGDRKEDRRKQRHTAKRIFERLRDEHGFTGGYTIVKDYVREHPHHFESSLRRMDRDVRLGAPDRGTARPSHPLCPYPGNERRELPPQPQPRAETSPHGLIVARS